MTRGEFDAISRRASAELASFARAAGADILRIRAQGFWFTRDEWRRTERRARADHARLLAALDQLDAAYAEVPPEWLPPGEGAP